MRFRHIVFLGLLLAGIFIKTAFAAEPSFAEFCASAYHKKTGCPTEICQLQCADGSETPECPMVCLPRECQTISVTSCPAEFCSVVVDCSEQKNCLPKIPEDQVPECGSLAYSAQDVHCCSGLVKRCGFDYLDGSCNMQGKGTVYRFPICIPCGDGVCTNFENHCNCPEDCKKEILPLN